VDFPTFGSPTIPALNISADAKAGLTRLQSGHEKRRYGTLIN
jgi:hypothetical protein